MIIEKEIKMGIGLPPLIFGLSQNEVRELIGTPGAKEEVSYPGSKDVLWSYNYPKITLTFDSEDDCKLGSIDIEDPKFTYNGLSFIGKDLEWIVRNLQEEGEEGQEPTIDSLSHEENPNLMMLFYAHLGFTFTLTDYKCTDYCISPLWKNEEEQIWPKRV